MNLRDLPERVARLSEHVDPLVREYAREVLEILQEMRGTLEDDRVELRDIRKSFDRYREMRAAPAREPGKLHIRISLNDGVTPWTSETLIDLEDVKRYHLLDFSGLIVQQASELLSDAIMGWLQRRAP